MCGICGILNFNSDRVSEDILISMRDSMIHRGPDDKGLYIEKNGRIGLGHRRLSIIDLSPRGRQPMTNENSTIWIVFNGEIYNYIILKKQLEAKGHIFKSDSDTEVIIHLYEEKGTTCVYDLEGEFAFAIWDENIEKLFLVRDRMGVKPLYYTLVNDKLLFASEIKAILTDPEVPRKLNEEAFYNYLSFLTAPAPDTLFDGIKKLECGSWLLINVHGQITKKKYWDLFDNNLKLGNLTEDELSNRLLLELRRAVKYRKVSDVPIGVFLSGGIDSSTNVALFSEGESKPVKSFCVGYTGNHKSYKNEFVYASLMARSVGSEYYEKALTSDDLLNFLSEMVYYQDEPIADPVCVPLHFVSKLARDNSVSVCQVGEGSDELFYGYPDWLTYQRLESASKYVPRLLKKTCLELLNFIGNSKYMHFNHNYEKVNELLRRSSNDLPLFWGSADAFTDNEKKLLLSSRLKKKFDKYSSYEAIKPIRKRFEDKTKEKSLLNWMTYLDLNYRLPELLLMRADKMTMSVSLEARVPFLDHKLVEFIMSVPEKNKIKNNTLKYLLKKSIKGIIPDEIINRKKQGFGVPLYEWFSDDLKIKFKKDLLEFCDKNDILDKSSVVELINSGDGQKVWYLINFVLWYNYWIKGTSKIHITT